ncbi:MAG: lysophospholipid acyltransferase family protein [Tepidisphaeraceae bacterium]|jgi:1-acyl-sn-glycerol-3-phosphate acyltransferase/long-chain acyl-CoA synthetase
MSEPQWHYETAADIDQTLAERLRHFPREPDMFVYGLRSIAAMSLRAWLRLYHRLQIVGRENLPGDGSFVMVSNHSSHLDALALLAALPARKVHRAFPAVAEDYFFVSLPRAVLSSVFINALPFGRKVRVRQSLDLCRRLLANPGNILILFPEGTRSTTGQMAEFRPGIGALAAGLDVPVVPCAVQGAFAAWPKGCFLPRPRAVRLVIGKPRNYAGLAPHKELAQQISAELRDAVQELLCR